MSIGKISNKKLSRNFKTRRAPLRVLPMPMFYMRHQVKQKKIDKKHISPQSLTIRYISEEVTQTKGKSRKMSGRKGPIKVRAFKNLHLPRSTLQWILVLIVFYIAAGVIIVMIQEGTELLRNIVVYSIIGFFTFFMGYIGWILARDVLEIVSGKKNIQNEAEA